VLRLDDTQDLTHAGVAVEPFFISDAQNPFDTSKFYSVRHRVSFLLSPLPLTPPSFPASHIVRSPPKQPLALLSRRRLQRLYRRGTDHPPRIDLHNPDRRPTRPDAVPRGTEEGPV
jgi:hypothetical protein